MTKQGWIDHAFDLLRLSPDGLLLATVKAGRGIHYEALDFGNADPGARADMVRYAIGKRANSLVALECATEVRLKEIAE